LLNKENKELKKKIINKNRTIIMVRIALFVALITAGAFVRIPLPFGDYVTLQIFFVIFSGLMLGPIYGSLAVVFYIALGLFGLPIFAGGGGLDYIIRPTFGYLIGFIISAFVVGIIAFKKEKLWKYFVACFVGIIITYIIGLTYKYFALNYWFGGESVALWAMIVSCVPVYLPCDIVLSIIAAILGFKLKKYAQIGNK